MNLHRVILLIIGLFCLQPVHAQENAFLRVGHFSGDTGQVDVRMNGELFSTAFSYPDLTDWRTLPEGTYRVSITPPGAPPESTLTDPVDITLEAGNRVTIAVVGSLTRDTLVLQTIMEDHSPGQADQARISVLNASTDEIPVQVLANDDPIITDLDYQDVTSTEINADNYDLTLADEDDTVLFALENTELLNRRHYFIALVGPPANAVFVMTDQLGQDPSGHPKTAKIRFAHLATDVDELDVYLDDELEVAEEAVYPSFSSWIEIPAGEHTALLSLAEDATGQTIINPVEITVEPDVWYTLAAIGREENDTLAAQLVEEDYSPLTAVQTRITFFHSVQNGPPYDVTINGSVFAGGLSYPGTLDGNDGAATFTLTANTYDITVTGSRQIEDVQIDLPETILAAGNHYFVALINNRNSIDVLIQSVTQQAVRNSFEK